MKNRNYLSFLIFSIILVMGSCRARFYTPNRNPVPLFKNSGDLYVDASTNLINKYDLTAGYAISKNIGAYAGFAGSSLKTTASTDSLGNTTNSKDRQYRGDMMNFGLGYFLNQEESANFRFEVFGDIAYGNYRNSFNQNGTNLFLNGNYRRIGIMPNIGYTSSDNNVSVAYSVRISQISFYNSSNNNPGFWQSDLNRLNSKLNYTMLEHALSLRAGGDHVKFQFQFGMYHGLNSDELLNAIPLFNVSAMFGIVINANVLGKG